MSDGAWTTVTRRKPYPANWRHAPKSLPTTKPFIPYQATFSQIVSRSAPTAQRTAADKPPSLNRQSLPTPSQPTKITPQTQLNAPPRQHQPTTKPPPSAQYTSNHTTPGLRFPPSPSFPEWRGKCFRCCQTGHTVATCRNRTKCGRCWGDGHIGQRCNKRPQLRTQASQKETVVTKVFEPTFDELLEGGFPSMNRPLPHGRPAKTSCYIARNEDHYNEIERLKRAVVLYAPNTEFDLSIDQIAEYASMTGLTTAQDVSIGILTKSRYLIHLPPGIDPIQFINAIPNSVWEKGYSFWQWSPAMDSTICNPKFKILLDLDGIPVHISKENEIASAIGAFGVYLGTLEQSAVEDVACWTVAVAVAESEDIPLQIEFVMCGRKTPVEVRARTWLPIPLYKNEEIPQPPIVYTRTGQWPAMRVISSGEESDVSQEGDRVAMTKQTLLELCRDRDLESLPSEIQAIVAGDTTFTQIQPAKDPKPVTMVITQENDVAGTSEEEAHTATPTEQGERPQEIILPPTEETDCADILQQMPPQANKETQAPKQNQLRRTGGDKRALKLKQPVIDSCSKRGSEPFAGGLFKKRAPGVSLVGHHVLRHPITQKKKLTRGECSNGPQPNNGRMAKKGPRATNSLKEKEKAQLLFDPKGFIEVHVEGQHVEDIAKACGIPVLQINSLLVEDNTERIIQQELNRGKEAELQPAQRDYLSDRDPQSEEDFSSESD